MPRRRDNTELPDSYAVAFRELRDEFRADYAIGENSRFTPMPRGIASAGSGADYHYRSETRFLRGIERARHYDRNDMVVGQGVNRVCANIVQTGYNLDVQTGDEKLDAELEKMWWDWADDPDLCDLEGEKTFGDLELLTLRHTIVDGDILSLLLGSGQLQLVEAHQLRTPAYFRNKLVHGIQLDPRTRQRVAYYVMDEGLDPLQPAGRGDKYTRYDARDGENNRHVLHLYDPRRYTQRRGVTALAPIGEVVGMHGDVQFATLVKAQVASSWAIIEEAAAISPPTAGGPTKTGTTTTEVLEDGTTRTVQGISPGMRVKLAPGVKATGFSPNIPNPEFFPHAMLLLTFIAINLDIPVHVLLLDPSKTNFSGWRGAIDQARIRFRQIQQWHIRRFHSPVYRWKLRQFAEMYPHIAAKQRSLGPAFYGHAWHPDAWSYIEPQKDAAADLLQTSNLMLSERRRAMRLGMQFKPLINEIIEDRTHIIREAQKAADALNQELGLDLTWRDIAPLPTPQGITGTLDTAPEPDPADPKKEPASA